MQEQLSLAGLETVRIPLWCRDGSIAAYTTVDAADAPELLLYRWHLSRTHSDGGYAVRSAPGGGSIRMHRVLLGLERGNPLQADHINGVKLDNRRANLRVVTAAQNQQNRIGLGRVSRYRNVSFKPERNKWRAMIAVNGRPIFGGHFDTEEEAAVAARALRAKHMPYANELRCGPLS
jgi:parvulin-like peptidyl-prolyl isomerase